MRPQAKTPSPTRLRRTDMKSNPRPPAPADHALHNLLQQWRVAPELPPHFTANVWRRIEGDGRLAERRSSATGSFLDWLLLWLPQPRFAVAYLFVVIAIGAGVGAWQGRASATALTAGLQGRYVQSIDPYAYGALVR